MKLNENILPTTLLKLTDKD